MKGCISHEERLERPLKTPKVDVIPIVNNGEIPKLGYTPPQGYFKRSQLESEHPSSRYSPAEAFLKELMVTLKVFYEAVASCRVTAKDLQMVENKLQGSEYNHWLSEFRRKAQIYEKITSQTQAVREKLTREILTNEQKTLEQPSI
jgi:hypothetical protein